MAKRDLTFEFLRPMGELRLPADTCDHGVAFDVAASYGLSADEVRERWPRFYGLCTKCGYSGVAYASYEHYLAGDW
jgi:hypothetical protein